MRLSRVGPTLGWALCVTAGAAAQGAPQSPPEAIRLAVLQREALNLDPRLRELDLQEQQTKLRVRNIEVERLPSVGASASAQYQSDVPKAPLSLPNGEPLFSAPKVTYDASLRVDLRLWDPTARPRVAAAQAELAESQARLRTTLYALRAEVSDSFFAAALLQEQMGALAAVITDLEARLREATTRVREGAAVPADADAIEATLLQDRQQRDELDANRRAALTRLEKLVGHAIAPTVVLALPDVATAAAQARREAADLRARPEYEQFARARDRSARQQDVALSAERPQVSAFTRVGYGRPGLNFISDQFEPYAVAGAQVQWKAWTWGAGHRERNALALQQSIVSAEESAFAASLARAVTNDAENVERLERAIATDDRIVELRGNVERAARARLREGAITAAEYVDRTSESLGAQFARARHRVELAQAQTRLVTAVGLEVR